MSSRVFGAVSLLCLAVVMFASALLGAFVLLSQRNTELANAHQVISNYQHTINTLQKENQTLKDNPEFVVWNSCGGPCDMTADQVRAGGVPDTFDLVVSFTSTTPITVHFMTLTGWTEYSNCSFQISCVKESEHAASVGPVTSLQDYTFKLAEGCASYVVVFQAAVPGVISPNERVRYNPSSVATGACA
jgi:hypothetical protein